MLHPITQQVLAMAEKTLRGTGTLYVLVLLKKSCVTIWQFSPISHCNSERCVMLTNSITID